MCIVIATLYQSIFPFYIEEMSLTISNCQNICHSPTNLSKSKMLYSFSKAERFKVKKNNPCDKFYQIGNQSAAKRTTALGYDHKYDFTKDLPNSPPPNTYSIATDFDANKTKRRGFGFGGGRQEMEVTGPLCELISNKNPGPGSYQIPSAKAKASFSLRAKFDFENKEPLKVPGPGSCTLSANKDAIASHFNKRGKNILSKNRNVSATLFCKSVERFNYPLSKAPGPGSYDYSKTCMSKTGQYFFSKIQNSKARRFPSATRQTLPITKLTPGPGEYQLPSEFGYYLSKNANKQIKRSRVSGADKENFNSNIK